MILIYALALAFLFEDLSHIKVISDMQGFGISNSSVRPRPSATSLMYSLQLCLIRGY